MIRKAAISRNRKQNQQDKMDKTVLKTMNEMNIYNDNSSKF